MTSYDELPYTSKMHRGRHIERLATIAHLRGVKTEHPTHARVFEIGCGTGEALIPMALEYPQARFVGVDPSERSIADGRRLLEELQIENVELHCNSVDAISVRSLGQFDFVLCHGVFSWVNVATQQAVFAAVASMLNSHGVAFVSYNTTPGNKIREIAWDLVSRADRPALTVSERATAIRSRLERLIGAIPYDFEQPYTVLVHRELSRILAEPDGYLFHEVLADDVSATSVTDFVAQAHQHGLAHIGDARFHRMAMNRLLNAETPSQAFQNIVRIATSDVEVEQVMDDLFGASYRESLLCRDTNRTESEIGIDAIQTLSYAGYFETADQIVLDDRAQEFTTPRGKGIRISKPLFKAALEILTRAYPNSVSFAALLSASQHQLRRQGIELAEYDNSVLAGALLEWMQREFVEPSLLPMSVAERVYAHPKTTDFIRWQARTRSTVTNLFCETVEIGPLEKALLQHLDGLTAIDELQEIVEGFIREGAGGIKEDGQEVTDPERRKELMTPLVEATLETLRRAGLLMRAG